MSVNVFVVSKNVVFWDYVNRPQNSTVKYIGYILDEDLAQLQKIAETLNLGFLGLIDSFDHMVFNRKHMKRAMDELKIINEFSPAIVEKFGLLMKAIDTALKQDGLYVKFESD